MGCKPTKAQITNQTNQPQQLIFPSPNEKIDLQPNNQKNLNDSQINIHDEGNQTPIQNQLSIEELQKLVKNTLSLEQKIKAIQCITRNDEYLIKTVFTQNEIHPLEDLSFNGKQNITSLHIAASLDAYNALNIIYSILQEEMQLQEIINCFNIPQSEGLLTPAMICAQKNHFRSFYILSKRGLINKSLVNEQNQTVEQIARMHSSLCYQILQGKIIDHQILQSLPNISESENENTLDSPFYDLQKQYENTPDSYIDDDFPASQKSIMGENHSQAYEYKKITWQRIQKILDTNDLSFIKNSSCSNRQIILGMLSSKAVLGAIYAILEYPKLFQSIFLNKTINKNGLYSFQLYYNGKRQEVIIDDQLPHSLDNSQSSTSQTNLNTNNFQNEISSNQANEAWLPLLEKSLAKINGGYLNLKLWSVADVFECLLDSQTVTYYSNLLPEDDLWNKITNHTQKCHPIIAQTSSNEDDLQGLLHDTFYVILSTHIIQVEKENQKSPNSVRIIKLRKIIAGNGSDWSGKFSNQYKLWQNDPFTQYQTLFNEKDKEAGIFCMEFCDFQSKFSQIFTALHGLDWNHQKLQLKADSKHATYLSITINSSCQLGFWIKKQKEQQENQNTPQEKSSHSQTISKVKCMPTDIWIAKKEETQNSYKFQVIVSPDSIPEEQQSGGNSIGLSKQQLLNLEPGEYIVKIKPRSTNRVSEDIVAHICTDQPVKVTPIMKPKDFMIQFFISLGKYFLKDNDFQEQVINEFCNFKTKQVYASYGNYQFIYCEAINANKPKTFKIKFSSFTNCALAKVNSLTNKMVRLNDGEPEKAVCYIKPINPQQPALFEYEYLKNGLM